MIEFTEAEKNLLRTFLLQLSTQELVDYAILVLPILIDQQHPSVTNFVVWLQAQSSSYGQDLLNLDNKKAQDETLLTNQKNTVDALLQKF